MVFKRNKKRKKWFSQLYSKLTTCAKTPNTVRVVFGISWLIQWFKLQHTGSLWSSSPQNKPFWDFMPSSSRQGREDYREGMTYKIHDRHWEGEQESPTCSSTGTKRHQVKLAGSWFNTKKGSPPLPSSPSPPPPGALVNLWNSSLQDAVDTKSWCGLQRTMEQINGGNPPRAVRHKGNHGYWGLGLKIIKNIWRKI